MNLSSNPTFTPAVSGLSSPNCYFTATVPNQFSVPSGNGTTIDVNSGWVLSHPIPVGSGMVFSPLGILSIGVSGFYEIHLGFRSQYTFAGTSSAANIINSIYGAVRISPDVPYTVFRTMLSGSNFLVTNARHHPCHATKTLFLNAGQTLRIEIHADYQGTFATNINNLVFTVHKLPSVVRVS